MFIVELTYTTELSNVDKFLNAHVEFLNEQYELGYFHASGPKVPRTGGIILSNVKDKKELEAILEKDPFKINGLADYQITEFIPRKTSEELQFLIS